jgi:hypothetical protein
MRTNRLLYVLVVVYFKFFIHCSAQMPAWAVVIKGNAPYSAGLAIIQSKDGGYAVGIDENNIILPWETNGGGVVKLDSSGNLQWIREFSGRGGAIIQAADHGYVTVGSITMHGYGLGSGGGDIYVVKIDSAGNYEWTETIGGIENDVGNAIALTKDGGYAITGSTNSYGLGNSTFDSTSNDVYLLKLNSEGSLLWSKTIGGGKDDEGFSIVQTKDAGYAITGETNSFGMGGYDVYVIKVDSTGNLQWTKTIGGGNNDIGNSIIQSRDGGYAITGVTYSFNDTTNGDVYAMKLDSSGNLQWTQTIGGTSADEGFTIAQATNGNYVITGNTSSFGSGGTNIYFIELDSTGNLVNTKTIGGIGNVSAASMVKTRAGGFAIAGNSPNSYNAAETYLLLLDSAGNNCYSGAGGGLIVSGGIAGTGGSITSADSGRVEREGEVVANNGTTYYLCSHKSGSMEISYSLNYPGCKNYPDGGITLTVSGGTSSYTYSWMPNVSDTAIATNLSGGTFTITIEDSVKDSVTVVLELPYTSDVGFLNNVTNTTCSGSSNGSISLTNFSGTPPFTFMWSNGITSSGDSGLSAGIYSVMVSDSCGDITTASFTITQSSDLSISASTTANISCYNGNNGSASANVISGTSPFIYLWSDPDSQSSFLATGLNAGTYTVTVSDSCGNASTASVIISQPSSMAATILSGNILCNGRNDGMATVSVTDTLIANYVFDSVVQHFPVPAGVTTITLTIAGAQGGGGGNGAMFTGVCPVISGHILSVVVGQEGGTEGGGGGASWVYDSNIVLYNPIGIMGLLAVAGGGGGSGGEDGAGGPGFYPGGAGGWNLSTNSPTNGSTSSDTGGFGGSAGTSGGGWLSSAGSPYGGMDEANHFSGVRGRLLNVQNGGFGGGGGGGYTSMMGYAEYGGGGGGFNGGGGGDYGGGGGGSFFVNTLPVIHQSQMGNGYVNILYIITGNDSTFNYSWSNGETTYTATGLSAGTYSLTVSNSNGCSATTSITITQPDILSISANSISNINCNGGENGSASMNVSGGTSPYTYLWSDANSQTTISATALIAGTYSVMVTDSNGCTATASVSISQPNTIIPTITVYSGIRCNGDSDATVIANATGGSGFYIYQWSDASSQTNAVATGLATGTYTATVTDNNGCTGTSSIAISQPPILSLVTDSINTTNGNCNGSAWAIVSGGTNPYSYFWTGGLTTDTILNQCANYYCCTITDAHGCIDSVCTNIDVSTGTNELKGDPDSYRDGKVKVYPNPNNGYFTISLSHAELVSASQSRIEIYNVLGEQVYNATLKQVQGDNLIDLSNQSNGVYFYRVITEDGNLVGSGKIVITK